MYSRHRFCSLEQAAFDMMPVNKRSQLLQKLAAVLITNAITSNVVELVVFVAVDLINRIDHSNITDPEERVLYASMNDKAGKKALAVPDFTRRVICWRCCEVLNVCCLTSLILCVLVRSALKYSESAISLLDPSHWETHHDLMLSSHQTSALALYSCANPNQDLFKTRVNLVFEHASSLEEEFETRYTWIRFISTTSLEEAISECHRVLERLGESNGFLDISPDCAHSELVRVKEAFLEDNKEVSTWMVDSNKLRAMKIMASLFIFYYFQHNPLQLVVSSRMVELSMQNGWSEDSIFALASFGALLVTSLGDIDQGSRWCRLALQLMSKYRYNVNVLLPRVVSRASLLKTFFQC